MMLPLFSFLHPPPQLFSSSYQSYSCFNHPPESALTNGNNYLMFTTYRRFLIQSLCYLSAMWNYFLFSPLTSDWFLLRMTISSSEYILNPHYFRILYLIIHILKHFCLTRSEWRSFAGMCRVMKFWVALCTDSQQRSNKVRDFLPSFISHTVNWFPFCGLLSGTFFFFIFELFIDDFAISNASPHPIPPPQVNCWSAVWCSS